MTATASPLGQNAPWSTPQRLKVFRAGVWVLTAALLAFGLAVLAEARHALHVLEHDTVPSIIAAEEIGYALADLDANVANSLLGNAQHRTAAASAIEKQRLRVSDSLVDAARHVTASDAETAPIRAMTRDLGLYLERAAEARLLSARHDEAAARATYWGATELLHTRLLRQASDLDAVKKGQLDRAYGSGARATDGAEVIAVVLGAGLVVVLASLQAFLFRATRRVLNPAVAGATLGAVLLAGVLASRLTTTRESLRVAKEDAFDSIHALVRARTIAYDANGDESRLLFDARNEHGMDDAFRKKVALLTSVPLNPPHARRKTAISGSAQGGAVTGLLIDELANITFDGEETSATRMVTAFRDYMEIDARIRKLAAAGRLEDAIELCIGDRPDESNAAFDRFDAGLASTLDINRAAFDREIDRASRTLAEAEEWSALAAAVVAVLTWLGLRPRLREYTA